MKFTNYINWLAHAIWFRLLSITILVFVLAVECTPSTAQGHTTSVVQNAGKTLPVGYVIIEGDMLIRNETDSVRSKSMEPNATYTQDLWVNGEIHYEFDDSVLLANRELMRAAMKIWEAVANVQFIGCVDNNCDGSHVRVSAHPKAGFNDSAVGRQGGEQDLRISDWTNQRILLHELGHTLGYWHEQTRPDRDKYVEIKAENIAYDRLHDFETHSNAGYYNPYDFESIMHYDQFQGSNNGMPTIIVKSPNQAMQDIIGTGTNLSYWDKTTMSFLYPQPNWRFAAMERTGVVGGINLLNVCGGFQCGYNFTPEDGILYLLQGIYSVSGEVGSLDKPMTLKAPWGSVTLK